MRYVQKDAVIPTRKGTPLQIGENGTRRDWRMAELLAFIGAAYEPSQTFRLSVAEIRHLNKALDVLEGEPFEDNFYYVEDTDWEALKKVVANTLPYLSKALIREAPAIEDAVNAVPTKKPALEGDDDADA